MGVSLKGLVVGEDIELKSLKGKVLAVDSYNMLYQFLTTIRARDGSLLTDSGGNITSHLVGLFSRTTRLMQYGLRLAFVFDGIPPKLKEKERERRKNIKIKAEANYKVASDKGNIKEMKKYAARMSRLTPEMVLESKKIIRYLGLPVISAPSEGEAQAAFMAKQGDVYAVISQDFDSILHGAPILLRNISIAGKRKKANKLNYESINPERINLTETLNKLNIDGEQLIALAMLVGTDYNIGGIKGIGPKKALDMVKKHEKNFDDLFKEAKWEEHFEFPWTEVYYTIKKIPTTEDYELEWNVPDEKMLLKLLVDKHDFSESRVINVLNKLTKENKSREQKGLNDFF